MSAPSPEARLLARLAPVPVALAFVILALRSWFVCDDAFISFRYSRNWADGLGLRFNDDGAIVEGFSNPVWVILGAAARLVGLDEVVVLPALSLLLALGVIFGAAAWAPRVAPSERRGWVGWATLLLLGLSPGMATWASSGLETMQYTAAWFATFVAWIERAPVWVRVVCAGVLVASRPEGFLWVGVLAVAGFPFEAADPAKERVRWGTAVGGVAALLLALLAWRWVVFGDVVANTAYAKGDSGAWYYLRGLQYVVAASIELVLPAAAAPLVFAELSTAVNARRVTPVAALSLAAAGHYAFAVATGGDYMAFGRFLVPGLPLYATLVAVWVARLPWSSGVPTLAVLATLSLLPHFNVALVPAVARAGVLNYRRVPNGMPYERAHMEMERDDGVRNARAGRLLRHVLQPGETLYQTAIGRVGYYSHGTLIDRCYLVERMPPGVTKSRDKKPGHDSCVMSLSDGELVARRAISNFDVVSVPPHAREQGVWSVSYPKLLRTFYPAWEVEPGFTEGQYFIVDRHVAADVVEAP